RRAWANPKSAIAMRGIASLTMGRVRPSVNHTLVSVDLGRTVSLNAGREGGQAGSGREGRQVGAGQAGRWGARLVYGRRPQDDGAGRGVPFLALAAREGWAWK